jgi:iron complex outermembrane receptor protein
MRKQGAKAVALLGASALSIVVSGFYPSVAAAQRATVPSSGTTAPATKPSAAPRPPSAAEPQSTAPVAPSAATSATAPAQTAPTTGDPDALGQDFERPTRAPDAADVADADIIVTGARAAEASAISRKRSARTAQDSIVADDVGQFPDKNAAEAIARIAGVALDVSDSGEQGGFTIRGQSADLIRVEVDGMTALSTNDQGGRASSIGELSSDLIKSVDVIKGQTADMTPGGVGGTVRIEQRSGLDFKEPLYRLNLQSMYQSLSERASPRINAIATRKFFDGDVGLIVNGTYEDQKVATDYARVTVANAGYIPLGDYDNSPGKSFTTPFDPVAAAVTTKAGCAALSTTGINSRLNCYAQWEDFVPSFPRPGRQIKSDQRLSFQVRADWRVNRDLTLFASYNPNFRRVSSQDYNWSVATPVGTTNTAGALTGSNIRNVVVNDNHYVTAFDIAQGTGNQFSSSLGVTSQIRDIQRKIAQHYAQTGADFISGPWTAKARVQYSRSSSSREDNAFSFVAPVDVANYSIQPESGLWNIKVPNVDLFNPASYYPTVGVNGVSTGAQYEYTPYDDKNSEWNYQLDVDRTFDNLGPIVRVKAGIQHRTRDNESYRNNGSQLSPGLVLTRAQSLDLIQFCDPARAPAATPCQFGSTPRVTTAGTTDQLSRIYTLTRDQYQNLINASLVGLPGAEFYGGAPNRGDLISSWGTYDVGKFQDALKQYINLDYRNLDCLYECTASDGKIYKRPTYLTSEVTSSAYAMLDFETRPLGLLVNGNIGVRYQRIKVDAQPVIDFSRRVATPITTPFPGYTIENQLIRREVGDVNRTSEDWLPSFNLAIWPIDEKLGLRYSAALQRARPSILQLTGNGTVSCGVVDPAQRAALEAFIAANPGAIQDDDPSTDDSAEGGAVLANFVNRCTGRIGNAELKGYGATTQNLSLEWYPNRDTQLSAAIYQISVRSGRPEDVNIGAYELDGETYEVATYQDGPSGLRQRGFEVAGRTAFTFLPGFLRHTGGGFNYSFTKSNETNTFVDLFSGVKLPPRSESKYYYNVNLWYDDGKVNARIAYQKRDIYYNLTEGNAVNRVPAIPGVTGSTSTTSYYKIVSPVFKNGTETLDARASYALSKSFQLFVEGKNLLGTPIAKYAPSKYRDIGGGVPYMYDSLYAGKTYYAGAIITF